MITLSTLLLGCVLLTAIPVSAQWKPLVDADTGTALYEPSGIRQLADGRLLVIQDEPSDPFALFELVGQRVVRVVRPSLQRQGEPFWILGGNTPPHNLNDLEGLAQNPDGYIYAITSHSRTESSGSLRKSRQKLVRFRIQENSIVEYSVFNKLRKAIIKAYPQLKPSTKLASAKSRTGFNIEGLCFDASGKRLLIGLRGPILDGNALILILENPQQIFDGDERPRFARHPVEINTHKGGIRSLTYVPSLQGYLLTTQRARKSKKSSKSFQLWFLKDLAGAQPRRIKIKGVNLRKTEGITPIRYRESEYLILVSDDGNRATESPARYRLLPLQNIRDSGMVTD